MSGTKAEEEEEDTAHPYDPTLDYGSAQFDPMKALYAADLVAKVAHVKTYDNVAMFEAALKRVGIDNVWSKQAAVAKPRTSPRKSGSLKAQLVGTSSGLPARRFLPHQGLVSGTGLKAKHTRDLFSKIRESTGPLGALKSLVQRKVRIKVYTRKEHSVRGVTTGFLLLFDKHWNMILADVCETWTRRKYAFSENKTCCGDPEDCTERLASLGIAIPEVQVKSLNRKYVECTRRVKQLMIRGEQVVLVAAAMV